MHIKRAHARSSHFMLVKMLKLMQVDSSMQDEIIKLVSKLYTFCDLIVFLDY